MNAVKTKAELLAEAKSQMNDLQTWFAARCYGWRELASPEQLRMFTGREREADRLSSLIEELQG